MTSTSTSRRDRWVIAVLTVLLGIGLVLVGLAAAAVLIWLFIRFGPVLPLLLCGGGVAVYFVIRTAVRDGIRAGMRR